MNKMLLVVIILWEVLKIVKYIWAHACKESLSYHSERKKDQVVVSIM